MLKKILSYLSMTGYLTYSAFIICIISGIILSLNFNVNDPYESISSILLYHKVSIYVRSIHYWSAQFTLILFILHLTDHLLKKSEYNLKNAVWLRLILTIPIIFYALFSGFLLRGDLDAMQARLIVTNLIDTLPFWGSEIKTILFGTTDNFLTIYIHHLTTASLIIWITTIEHTKNLLPNARFLTFILIPVLIISFLLIPGLQLPGSTIIKGPWYFLGIQEILHWLNHPVYLIYYLLLIILMMYFLPILNNKMNDKIKLFVFISLCIYIILAIIGSFFRYDNWEFDYPWNRSSNTTNILSHEALVINNNGKFLQLPLIRGAKEGCTGCHKFTGFVKSHNINVLGCSGCHLGNPLSLNKNIAHTGIVLIPGNLSNAKLTCGNNDCHPNQVNRVENSLMNTMSGIISVDKFAFDENNNLDNHYNINNIDNSFTDIHLKNLCASCHLSKEKIKFGPVSEISRGGGCNSCHLNYDDKSLNELKRYQKFKSYKKDVLYYHPQLTIKTGNEKCFGCHSRSGRISLNYEGWHETKLAKMPVAGNYRKLQDGRILIKKLPDIHHESGLECIDCHVSSEIMGDGKKYAHKEDAIKILCSDCHSNDIPKYIKYENVDYETQRIIDIRGLYIKGREFLKGKNDVIYPNIYNDNGVKRFRLKNKEKTLALKPASLFCGKDIKGHESLTCKTCHSSWSPQCIGCHTGYEKNEYGFDNLSDKKIKGVWIEQDGLYLAEPATLGVKLEGGKRSIENFVPGMIMTYQNEGNKIFKRLFAPAFSHTIRKESRSCKSCHFTSIAMGYGRGELKFDKKTAKISLQSKFRNLSYDNLPEDAWTGMFENPKTNRTTRKNYRPFNSLEQKRILTVGTCFSCHQENDKKLLYVFGKYDNYLKFTGSKCIVPRF